MQGKPSIVAVLAVTLALVLAPPGAAQQPTVGLLVNEPEAWPGYTLFAPMRSTETYLIDMGGHPVNSWSAGGTPGLMARLTRDGHLLRGVSLAPDVHARWSSAIGGGGQIEKYDWDGNLVWQLRWSDDLRHQHHDIIEMPNGNVMFIAWEWKSGAEAIAAGRNPGLTAGGAFWPDAIFEVQPTGPTTGDVVWSWHVWDHLIQDLDATKGNYGVVGDHPELIDINAPTDDGQLDFNHLNGIFYDEALDQIVVSSRGFSEFWVIDHSTTTAEAASHSGGRYGKGGDLLYRWGNPQKYRRGTAADRKLFNQHDAMWIPPGTPGAGNFIVFNNGFGRGWSSVEEIVPPALPDGSYDIAPGAAYGPADPAWIYTSTPQNTFFSAIISGAERLPNGNTLITEGTEGNLFEVTPDGRTVWRYSNPVAGPGPLDQGDPVGGFGANTAVFKARRYAPDYPGLAGRDLVPEEPLEVFAPPPPVPDGRNGTTPLLMTKLDPTGTLVRVTWDATTCPAADYNLLHGRLPDVPSLLLAGSACALGTSGSFDWSAVPAGNVYVLMTGVGDYAMYESSWGTDSFGRERNGYGASNECQVTTKSLARTCP